MATTTESPREHLAQSEFFGELTNEALDELADRVDTRSLEAGAVLCEVGDPGSSAFLITAGRFRAIAGDRVIGSAGCGEIVGEVSLMTDQPRTATLVAIRDSEVLELDARTFNDVLTRHPSCYRAVTAQLLARLQQVLTKPGESSNATVLAIVADGSSCRDELVSALLDDPETDAALADTSAADLAHLEFVHDLVVLAPDPDDIDGLAWAARQSDRTLFVVDAQSTVAEARPLAPSPPFELVLVHPPNTTCPEHTLRWLDGLAPTEHHHLRRGSAVDVGRLRRRLLGQEYVLVLSGGGARGLAHGGLIRSLREFEVPIDAIVAVSAGAVAGALVALGLDVEVAIEKAGALFGEGPSPIDLTVPAVAIASGSRINERLKEIGGASRTHEDLWLPTTFLSANLTTTDRHLHRSGLLWRSLRATSAIPGVFPPVAEPSGVLVDGGLIDNLPVDLARELYPGATVIASDVGKEMALSADGYPTTAELSGWRALRSQLRRRSRVPGMVRILAQLTALGGGGASQSRGELHIDFDLEGFGIFDFKKAAEITEVGYRQARPIVEAWASPSGRS